MLSNSRIPTTVQPADLKFYSWTPIILPIDERQRHLSITGSYLEGQEKYLANILFQDIKHVKYTETFGHLVPKIEHSQLIDQLIFIGIGEGFTQLIEKEAKKREIQSIYQIKTQNQQNKSSKQKFLELQNAIDKNSILFFQFDETCPEESLKNIEDMMKTISETSFRESLFSFSLVIENADFFIQSSQVFTEYFRKISNDSRKNQCTMSITHNTLEKSSLRGFKNHLVINQGNKGEAELTRCSHKERFWFMPFAPIEPI